MKATATTWNILQLASAAVAMCQLAGCTVGPDFLSPKTETPQTWTETSKATTPAPVNDAWWQSFRDPELSSLVERAAQSNLDLQEAALRISESRYEERIAAAGEWPSLSGNASYASTRFSTETAQGGLFGALGNIKGPPGFTPPSLPNPYDQYQVGFDASWEPDLFGGVKRSEEAAAANTEAAIEQRRGALVSLESEVARAYLDLRGTQAKLAIANDNLASERETLSLTRDRLNAKLGSDLDVSNASAQVTATESQVPALKREIDSDINQLSLLLAREPGALKAELEKPAAVPPTPPDVPIGLPGDLARRRPDIRAAEAELHAATAQIGVAVANLYPNVTFSAPFGLQAQRPIDLASWSAAFFQIGPTITIPIFEGGKLHAAVKLNEEAQKLAAVDYAKTVLSAVHDVENALVTYSTEMERRKSLEATAAENRRALTLAEQRYRNGVTTFLDVLNAQRTLLSTQLSLADSTQNVSVDLVALYKVLGGGWEHQDVAK